ncbi:MAG: DUF4302 domain-containing protein [Rikenellaceae bacterium]|jgi:hypothetical protein|nr:DUF4302 domain-containing protein [Rikenellaceae bacterium]
MKKLIRYILSLIPAIVVCSCSPQTDELFDKSAATRMNDFLANYRDILMAAPNGWEMAYYPEESQIYGGVTFLLRFHQDTTHVTVATVKYPTTVSPTSYWESTSTFHLSGMEGPVLTFDSYNDIITPYADPDSDAGRGVGYGYEGDIDFVIMEATATRIKLKGVKTHNRLVMTAIPAGSTWTERIDSLANIIADLGDALYTNYSLSVGNYTTDMVEGSFPVLAYVQPGEADPENMTDMAYAYTPTGISFYEPLKGFDKTVQHFDWDPAARVLTCTDPGVTATITPSHSADFIHYNDYLGSWKMAYINYSGNAATLNGLTMREVPPGDGVGKFQYMELGPFSGTTGFSTPTQFYVQIVYNKLEGLSIVPHYISGATHTTSGAPLIIYPLHPSGYLRAVTTDAGLPSMTVEFGDASADSFVVLYNDGGTAALVSSLYWWESPVLTRP